MDQTKKEHYKKLLFKEKERVENLLNGMEGNHLGSMEEYGKELSFYDNHPADLGTEVFMMEHDMGLKNKNKDIIYEIETSIDKLEEGNYGICENCGVEIEKDRLELIPYIKLCLDCSKKKLPLDIKMSFRPEEEDRESPFGRRNIEISDKTDMDFDREDSYQAVARYNKVEKDPSDTTGDNQGIFDETEEGIVEDVEKISEKDFKDTL
ncbi:TraR/DksA C4-type zinc finger protein [Anaerosalibacter massiliensis]|uniref:TraR/DksA C4-type zinc finger protein n=1 Tax=Anaerosalibacter massiliensis TaxID=1347392 RepID=A0A9X2MED0_9FIRM|nr:TraR/DksA C4-type zinc finger protein [Anaerosalibacter massiliensis]MCR2042558.1 TraR/DksA C4-type zinc finger protein [Anaerosalibacter massiliensis]